ncbi:MAG: chemotaxis protein CheA [Thermodesulfobacteriota bacterium]|nr:MAG: chemotaxis protein CheA [Thermodesulfobacteriota bacterium]
MTRSRQDNIDLTADEVRVLKETFYLQAFEINEQLGLEIPGLESAGDPVDSARRIKRLFHTLKGDSSSMGLHGLAELIHLAEDIMAAADRRAVGFDSVITGMLLEVADEIHAAVEADRNGVEYALPEGLMARMKSALSKAGPAARPRKDRRKAGAAVRVVPDEAEAELNGRKPPEPGADGYSSSIRVLSNKVDQLMDLVGELVTGRSMIEQLVGRFESKYPKDELVQGFLKARAFISRSLSDLQKNVLSIRMVPVQSIFRRFPRLAREYCKASGKEIDLKLRGEETELDKAIADMIAEPLLHIFRNAVDHGIEPPEERALAGKPRAGTIVIEASHHDGGIEIKVEDDGRGIDTERLRAKALERGAIGSEEAASMGEGESTELIFLPGLSTAGEVNGLSGRGIGMDIARASVEAMRGTLSVASRPGKGTVFTLRFPLTLSIIRAVLARIGGSLYALPLGSVAEIVRTRPSDIVNIAGRDFLKAREGVLLLAGIERESRDARWIRERKAFVIVVRHGARRIGLPVEALAGEREIVIKPIDRKCQESNVVSGASVLGNGKIALLLNVSELISRSQPGPDPAFQTQAAAG